MKILCWKYFQVQMNMWNKFGLDISKKNVFDNYFFFVSDKVRKKPQNFGKKKHYYF